MIVRRRVDLSKLSVVLAFFLLATLVLIPRTDKASVNTNTPSAQTSHKP